MEVVLAPEFEKLVYDKVGTGSYQSANDVIQAGLRLLQEQDDLRTLRLNRLRGEIQLAIDQVERGEVLTEEEVFAEFNLVCRAFPKETT